MKTLLLAENHPPTLEHLKAALTQAGYGVVAVSDPGSAMEHFVADRPDGVVVSVDFPRLDGAHLGQLIRGSDQGARVPVVVIDKGHMGKARGVSSILDLKANAYIADPLKVQDLLAKLAPLLSTSSVAQQATGLKSVLARPAVSSGDLRGYPLPALLHSFYRLRRDGVLVVAFRDLTRRVFILKGAPVNYDSTARQDSLPNYLQECGVLNEAQTQAVVTALGGGLRIGAALAEAGLDLQGEELLQKLRDYTREKVSQVLGMREGRYAFYAGEGFSDEVATVEVPALAPLLEGARRTYPIRVFAQTLKSHLNEFPVRSAEFGKELSAFGLNTLDLKLAMQINGRIPLRDLLAHGRGDLSLAYSLFWFLNLTGAVTFSKGPLGEGGVTGQDRIAPKRRKPLPAEQANELREAAVKIITGSYFRVLGLDIAADGEAVEKAYRDIATRFHPDSYAEYDTSEIQDLLDSVQEKLTASYRVLSVESKRKAYLQYLFSRMDAGRSSGVNVDAEIALKRGEAALKRRDPKSALRAFEEAVSLNPRESEYYSHLAWATYLAADGDQRERAKAAQKLLKKALGLNPYLERAMIISAIIEAETEGDASDRTAARSSARRKLLKVLEMNPGSNLAKAALRKVGR
ncbi:MAG TPA: DUF4388 domain-containing protein [Myxococcaceae bacterium]|nr:DUF4388 domain-containing protein [Myxococcaceae bacterium]